MKPNVLILRTAGTNCDQETAHAFELAGATAQRVHINQLLGNPTLLDGFAIIAFPGGFSYGDDIAAGRILANQVGQRLAEPLAAFVASGRPIIGICNGFQVLIKTELLPGALAGRSGQSCTLTHNDSGRFVDRWVSLNARSRKCIWTEGMLEEGTKGMEEGTEARRHEGTKGRTGVSPDSGGTTTTPLSPGQGPDIPFVPSCLRASVPSSVLHLPIAHGEGKFVAVDDAARRALWEQDQVALVYVRSDGEAAGGAFPDNPNGSVDDIAGICDASGLVLGLMPHPERHVDATQHPAWTSCATGDAAGQRQPAPGLAFFKNAVRHASR